MIPAAEEEEGGGGHAHGHGHGGGGGGHGHGHGRRLAGEQALMPLQGLNFFNLQDLLAKEFPNGVENAFKNPDKEGCEVIGYLEVNRSGPSLVALFETTLSTLMPSLVNFDTEPYQLRNPGSSTLKPGLINLMQGRMTWVPGSFSVSPGKSLQVGFAHIQLNVRTELNMTHTINKFAFGDGFPGFVSPLDGRVAPLPLCAPRRHSLCP